MYGFGRNNRKEKDTVRLLMAKRKVVSELLLILIVCLLVVTLVSCRKKQQALTIYTWPEMFPQELLERFTEETGIAVNYADFDTNETMLAKLQAAEGREYDFVLADDYIIEQAIGCGLVSELDRSRISTWSNINPLYQGQYYDPDDKYTVPCGAGIMEIVYRPSATGFKITKYSDLWDTRLRGRVGIIANPRVVNGIVLKMNGKSMNTVDLDEIRSVSTSLDSLVPNIRLVKDMLINDDLVSGEIDAGLVYSSQAVTAILTDPELELVLPEEGLGFGVMGGFVPSNAPNKDAAYKFIEFLNKPENAAEWFNFMGYYCTNSAAEKYIDPSLKNLVIIPQSFSKDDLEMIENIPGEASSVHEEVWMDFLNKLN